MTALQQLVEKSSFLFSDAAREDETILRQLEESLSVPLPEDIRWFWLSCGSGDSAAAPSALSCITDTLRYRAAVSLPSRFVVLDDRNDAGTVLLDTSSLEGAVMWVDSHAIDKIALGTLSRGEHDFFPRFSDWVAFCIEQVADAA
jgi:hypothetical protein